MPIVVTTPQPGDPFGLGFNIQWHTTLVGPFAPGTYWYVELSAPPNEITMYNQFINFSSNTVQTQAVNGSISSRVILPARPEWVAGQTAQLHVELNEPGSGVIDSENVSVQLDTQTGANYELSEFVRTRAGGSGAGLTAEEHDAVLQTNVGVIAMAGINPLELVGDLVQAIATHNPLGYGSLSVVYTISGDGELPNEDPVAPKWGVYWLATTIPAGLGHFHGQSEEYSPRVVQWRTVHDVGGTEMVTSINDAVTHGELWKFPVQTPRRLEYSILPGFILQAQWWQFP